MINQNLLGNSTSSNSWEGGRKYNAYSVIPNSEFARNSSSSISNSVPLKFWFFFMNINIRLCFALSHLFHCLQGLFVWVHLLYTYILYATVNFAKLKIPLRKPTHRQCHSNFRILWKIPLWPTAGQYPLSYLCLHFHRDKLPLPPIHHKSPSSLKSLTKNPHIACLWLMLLLCYCCQPASSLIMHKCLIKRWNNKGQNSENNINCESMPSDFQKDCKSNRWYRKLESS
jgi:hypothetical protein